MEESRAVRCSPVQGRKKDAKLNAMVMVTQGPKELEVSSSEELVIGLGWDCADELRNCFTTK